MPFGNFANHADCVRQNPDKDDPDAYCASIQARTENKAARGHVKDIRGRPAGSPGHSHPHKTGPTSVKKAVDAASHLNQAVRLALRSVVAKHKDKSGSTAHHRYYTTRAKAEETRERNKPKKSVVAKAHDPVKEEGDKKLKEADGVAADGAQDDQPFAVAYGPDNYDKLTKLLLAKTYLTTYRAAGAIVKSLENKQMNFPGNLEDHLKKAHAAIHGREMWDARYGDVCDLLKRARKLLHDIEKTAEVAEQGEGAPQVMGKADPVDKAASDWKEQAAYPSSQPRPTFLRKPPKGKRPPLYTPTAAQAQRSVGKALRKAVTSAARQAGR